MIGTQVSNLDKGLILCHSLRLEVQKEYQVEVEEEKVV